MDRVTTGHKSYNIRECFKKIIFKVRVPKEAKFMSFRGNITKVSKYMAFISGEINKIMNMNIQAILMLMASLMEMVHSYSFRCFS
jgi:hypothetical protein